MKTYAEIDIDETPIVVLGCGHLFTAESLDGLVGLHDVYQTNAMGHCVRLADISWALATKVPQCPDCQCPIRQYVTQRYNRVINRAVIDEMSKRFLVSGRSELEKLEARINDLEQSLEESRKGILHLVGPENDTPSLRARPEPKNAIKTRYAASRKLDIEISQFLRTVSDCHQPAQKLHEAIVHAGRRCDLDSMNENLRRLSIQDSMPAIGRDRRITLGGRVVQLRVRCVVFEDQQAISDAVKSVASSPEGMDMALGLSLGNIERFLQTCRTFVGDANVARLPKIVVEASLYFARVVQIHRWLETGEAKEAYVEEGRSLLEQSLQLCQQSFQNAEQLKSAIDASLKALLSERYELVTAEELAAIKRAMVSGPQGIATQSGHWYNCVNGHPVRSGLSSLMPP